MSCLIDAIDDPLSIRMILLRLDISLSVSVSLIEAMNCEKRFVWRLTIACRDVCGGDT